MICALRLSCNVIILKITSYNLHISFRKMQRIQKILLLCEEITPLNLCFYKEHWRKVKREREDIVQSKVSIDRLEITRSDLYSEIRTDKKKQPHETLCEGIYAAIPTRRIYLSQKLHVGISIRKQYSESYENWSNV